MKYSFLFLLIATIFTVNAQCSRQDTFTAIDNPEVYPIEGTVVMQFGPDGTKQVVFENDFVTIQGIELRVFLSTTERLSQGLFQEGIELEISTAPLQDDNGGQDMGDIITGSKTFDLPESVTITDFDYIIVQCVLADVLWGRATLGEIQGDCATLNIEDNILSETRIYPNPTTNVLNITNLTNKVQVELFDTLGRQVHTQMGSQIIDLSSFESGIYFVQLTQGEKQRTIKVIRQ